MSRISIKPLATARISFLINLPLQALFCYAAVAKISDVEKFRTEVGQSPLLTYFVGIIVVLVPLTEFATVALLFFPSTRRLGMYASLFLMTSFTAYIITIMKFAAYVPCSCGGILSDMTWSQHLTFNMVFTALALAGVLLEEAIAAKQINGKVYIPLYTR